MCVYGSYLMCANHMASESKSAHALSRGRSEKAILPSPHEEFVPYLMPEKKDSEGAKSKAAGPLGNERLSDLEIKWKHDKSRLFLPKPTLITL